MVLDDIGGRGASKSWVRNMGTDAGVNRREFLQSAGCFGMAVALLGLSSGEARALPVSLTEGSQNSGERRYPVPATDRVNVDNTAQLIVVRFAVMCMCLLSRARTRTTP